jgi:predicted hydrocarbon binding protein
MTTEVKTEEAQEPRYYLSNKMARTYLLALEDALGKNGINAVLNQAGQRQRIGSYPPDNLDLGWGFDEMGELNDALDRVYGIPEGRNLACRAGQAWFHHTLKDFGAILGIADVAFRLLPTGMKVKMGLNAMAEMFSTTSDQLVRVEEKEDHFVYEIHRCPECWGRSAPVSSCYANLGLIQESFRWVTGGKTAQIEETYCVAKGDSSCTFVIDKRSHDP